MECLDPVLWPSGLKGSDLESNDVEVCSESLPKDLPPHLVPTDKLQ